jgi:hypothetical protein
MKLVGLYAELLKAGYSHTTARSHPDDERKWDEDPVYHDREVQHHRFVHLMMANDSIFLYSESNGWEDASSVVASATRLMIAGFRLGMPLRGAIALGDLDIVDGDFDTATPSRWTAKSLGLVGLGLVRAAELEALFEWSGVMLSTDLIQHLEQALLGVAGDGGILSAWDVISMTRVRPAPVPQKRARRCGRHGVVLERRWMLNGRLLSCQRAPH